MEDISYEAFHKYVMSGQKQNKKNPGKFGTVEMYSFIIDGIQLHLLENKDITIADFLIELHKLHKDMVSSL